MDDAIDDLGRTEPNDDDRRGHLMWASMRQARAPAGTCWHIGGASAPKLSRPSRAFAARWQRRVGEEGMDQSSSAARGARPLRHERRSPTVVGVLYFK